MKQRTKIIRLLEDRGNAGAVATRHPTVVTGMTDVGIAVTDGEDVVGNGGENAANSVAVGERDVVADGESGQVVN
jgi:hypothetical protein